MQSILWSAWPPSGRSWTVKIACGSYIDDIRGNTTFVANYLYFFENSIIVNSLKFCFEGGGLCFSSPQKNFIKIGHRTWKIRSFLQTSPIFRVLASTLNGLLSRMLMGTSYSTSTTNKCRS